jgi:hypothetical protein
MIWLNQSREISSSCNVLLLTLFEINLRAMQVIWMKINARELREGVGKQIANNQTQKGTRICLSEFSFQMKHAYLFRHPRDRVSFTHLKWFQRSNLSPLAFLDWVIEVSVRYFTRQSLLLALQWLGVKTPRSRAQQNTTKMITQAHYFSFSQARLSLCTSSQF